MLSEAQVFNFANLLDEAVITRKEISRLTANEPTLDVNDGYRIQAAGIRLREARGETIVGYKMGLTSKAKMQQMGVSSPISGVLTSTMQVKDGSMLSLRDRIHPKIEPEIAYITKREMFGKLTRAQFLENCDAIVPALEIIDSRFTNFDFALPDVLADNCSSSGFILGSHLQNPRVVDAEDLPLQMRINGKIVAEGRSSAIYGHPVDSCLALIEILTANNRELPAYSIILTGGATAAMPIHSGERVELDIESLGSVSVNVTE